MQELINEIPEWGEKLQEESENTDGKQIIYELGHRSIKDGKYHYIMMMLSLLRLNY